MEESTGLVETVHNEVDNIISETDNKKLAVGIAIGVVAATTIGYAGRKLLNFVRKKNSVDIVEDEAEEL